MIKSSKLAKFCVITLLIVGSYCSISIILSAIECSSDIDCGLRKLPISPPDGYIFKRYNTADDAATRSEDLKARVRAACVSPKDPLVRKSLDYKRFFKNHRKKSPTLYYDHEDWWLMLNIDAPMNLFYPKIPPNENTSISYLLSNILGNPQKESANDKLFGKPKDSLKVLSTKQAIHVLKTYFKFAFFMEPLERLYTAYHSIFVERKYDKKLCIAINKSVLLHYGEIDNPVSFRDFLRYLLPKNSLVIEPVIWRPQVYISHPCAIRYDFIGYTSTMTEDFHYIAKTLWHVNISDSLFETKHDDFRFESVVHKAPPDLIKLVLEKHYWIDYEILGFQMPV